jgi:hypothetical protein
MRIAALAVEKRPAQFVLQLLNGTRQCRLTDIALVSSPGEVQRTRERDEIADLLHFHG